LKKNEREALEAVARQFSATWEFRNGSSNVVLTVAGRPIALRIAHLERRGTAGAAASVRLRFDKVATRLIERLKASLGRAFPKGATVVLTITAPIRLASKTAASLEARLPMRLGRGSPGRVRKFTIHRNDVRLRVLIPVSENAPRMIGFVHNADSDSLLLMNLTRDWIHLVGAEAGRWTIGLAGDRWLVVTSANGASCLQAHRYICSQLSMPTGINKILLVARDGRVEVLKSR
jgi:hypothetical protein